MKITIKAIGKLKSPEMKSLIKIYEKRLSFTFTFSWEEYEVKKKLSGDLLKKAEASLLHEKLSSEDFVIVLDERGKNITSPELATLLSNQHFQSSRPVVFIIGGAEGLSAEIHQRANYTLSLGKLTWPHMMVRLMLIEQLYRAQQIIAGHPYHKD